MFRTVVPLLLVLAAPALAGEAPRPLTLHPDNPHYFLFRGKPAILVTSGEHYGAVLNKDFNYLPYLDELQKHGFNLTRTFSGTYREVPGSFKIQDNTLAPEPKNYACPWARSDTPGAGDGGNKFDLARWDADYFKRLKDFVAEAGKRGIVVEVVLFCTLYDDKLWAVSPMNSANNVNGAGKGKRTEVFTLQDKAVTEVQDALARKIVGELRDFDNCYFEVCNEPYFNNVTLEWQHHIADVLADAEKDRPHRHLLAMNIANGSARVDRPHPKVGLLNFHYAAPPKAVELNYGLNLAVGDDETGFRGTGDRPYREEAWNFLLCGGAVFSHLDYSFSCKHPDGTFAFKDSPGGGGLEFRKQLAVLKRFVEGFDFLRMKPDFKGEIVRGTRFEGVPDKPGKKDDAPGVRCLVEAGKQYALYIRGGTKATLTLELPKGTYRAEWVNTRTGAVEASSKLEHAGGTAELMSPAYREDLALRLVAEK
jgi:hypothetical protein